jgi:hypothetical protein
LEQVMICPVDEGHVDVGARHRPGYVEPAETAADDNYVLPLCSH